MAMKKLFLGIIFILLVINLLNLAEAGKTIKIDFSSEREQLVEVNTGDRIEFSLVDGVHTMIIDKIHEKGVDLDTFVYIDRKSGEENVFYSTAIKGTTLRIDLDKDKVTDLLIGTYKIFNGDKAILILKLPDSEAENPIDNGNEITGDASREIRDVNDPNGKISLILEIVVGLSILVLVYFVFIRKK